MPASKRFMELTEQMKDIHKRKNAGYAGDCDDPWANFRQSELFGISSFDGCMIRLSDKFIRVANLRKNLNNDKVGESIKDTLIDLANYAIIAYCLYEEEEEKKQKGECNENIVSTKESNLKDSHEYFKTEVLRRRGGEMG
jgi:hypothetical protein